MASPHGPTYPGGMPAAPQTFAVDGMTCRACEVRVQRSLVRVPGVESVRADAARGIVTIVAASPVPRDAVAAAITRAGEDYRLASGSRRAWLTRDRTVWRDLAVSAALVGALALAVSATGAGTLADRVGGSVTSGSLGVVALLGLAAGFSTCMALVGGLVLAFSARAAQSADGRGAEERGASTAARWRSHLAFNAGRVVGFAALGAITGLVGRAVTLSGTGLAVAMLAVAIVMTLLGIQISGASPRLSAGLVPTLPDVLSGRLARVADGGGTARGLAVPAAVGAATYLLPCGFTQAVQVFALSTGNPAQGAAIMAMFALGTTPGLLAIGGLGASVRGVWAARFARFAAVGVLAFAAVNASAALGILAPGLAGGQGGSPTQVSANVRLADGVQYVSTIQVADGYEPASTVVLAGVPVVWRVESEALTCASWLRAPGLGDADGAVLTPGETSEFRFTPDAAGTLDFSCGMGMYWGAFEVIDPGERPAA